MYSRSGHPRNEVRDDNRSLIRVDLETSFCSVLEFGEGALLTTTVKYDKVIIGLVAFREWKSVVDEIIEAALK